MQEQQKILLVDDEEDLLNLLKPVLARCGYQVETAKNGNDAIKIVEQTTPDIIVSDILMPRMDGREFLRTLRKMNNWTPMILLSQVTESCEKAIALEEGADDYVNKPFEPNELIARIKAVLRRTIKGQPSLVTCWKLQAGDLVLDRIERAAFFKGKQIHLTNKAFMLIEYFITHPDEILSTERLLKIVWNWEYVTESRTVNNRVSEIRRVINDDAKNPEYIETISGHGFRFIMPVEKIQ